MRSSGKLSSNPKQSLTFGEPKTQKFFFPSLPPCLSLSPPKKSTPGGKRHRSEPFSFLEEMSEIDLRRRNVSDRPSVRQEYWWGRFYPGLWGIDSRNRYCNIDIRLWQKGLGRCAGALKTKLAWVKPPSIWICLIATFIHSVTGYTLIDSLIAGG